MPAKKRKPPESSSTSTPSKVSRRSRRLERLSRQTVAKAIAAGNLELVKKLLASQPDLDPGSCCSSENVRGSEDDGQDPCLLQVAAFFGQLEVLQLLVERFGTAWSNAPEVLRLACCDGALQVVQFCINTLKLDVRLGGVHKTPMLCACWHGRLAVVKFLAQVDADTLLDVTKDGMTVWHSAASQGHLPVLQYLMQSSLAQHSSCWQNDANQRSVLHLAALGGHTEVVKFLVMTLRKREARRRILQVDSCARNAISYSVEKKSVEMAEFLLKYTGTSDAPRLTRALLDAADVGSPEMLQLLVGKGAQFTCSDEKGWTPLHYAAYKNHLTVVAAIVNGRAQKAKNVQGAAQEIIANAKCVKGWTPLHYASGSGHLAIVQYLVEKAHADPNAHGDERLTALHRAAGKGRTAVCRYLVKEAGVDANFPDSDGVTPLHRAAMHGSLDIVEFLVKECGCDIDGCTPHGWTPLHFASDRGHLRVVKFILNVLTASQCMLDEPGSNPQRVDWRGWTPLHNAACEGHARIVECLLCKKAVDPTAQDHSSRTALHYAAGRGHCGVVKVFLKLLPADVRLFVVSAKSSQGLTALHRAACRGHVDVVRLLLKQGAATARTYDATQLSPLMAAAIHGWAQTVELLLTESDSDALAQDATGWNAFHHAASCGQLDVVSSFLAHVTMPIDERDPEGWTVLHCASYTGRSGVALKLLQAKADPNAVDYANDWTPLHYAAGNGHLGTVKIIVEAKGDPCYSGRQAVTPLHRAAQRNFIEVVRYFVLHTGMDPQISGLQGKTPLYLASGNPRPTVSTFLLEHIASTQSLESAAAAVAASTDKSAGGNSVLHSALRSGSIDQVKLVVEYARKPGLFLLKKFVWHLGHHKTGRTLRARVLQKISRMAIPSAPAVVVQPNESGNTPAAVAAVVERDCLLQLLSVRPRVAWQNVATRFRLPIKAVHLLRLATTAWPCCPSVGPDAKCACLHCVASGNCGNDGSDHSQCAMFLLRMKASVSQRHVSSKFHGLATTPLHEAVARADMSMVRLLVAAKASPGVEPIQVYPGLFEDAAVDLHVRTLDALRHVEAIQEIRSSTDGTFFSSDSDSSSGFEEACSDRPLSPMLQNSGRSSCARDPEESDSFSSDSESDDSSEFGPVIEPCRQSVETLISEDFF
eukprot:INCI12568.1.p1 GENE.INCI12568.1~~INCI12568.1.p1  ORF type:complete len:1155 (-),score=170.81 INCI12568.1:536-4000(-)